MTVKYSGPDIASKQLLEALQSYVDEYKSIDMTLTSADGDEDSAVQAFIESSDDPQAVKLRDQIEKLTAKLEEYAKANAVVVSLSDDERAKLTEQREALKANIRKGRGVVEDVAKTINTDFDNVMAALNELGDPTKSGRGRKPGSGGGSTLPRVSATLTIKEVSEAGDQALVGKTWDSFSAFALKFNTEVKDLQLAFAEAAGVKHEDIKEVTKSVQFAIQPNENGAVYVLETTPKERAPRKDSSKKSGEEQIVAASLEHDNEMIQNVDESVNA